MTHPLCLQACSLHRKPAAAFHAFILGGQLTKLAGGGGGGSCGVSWQQAIATPPLGAGCSGAMEASAHCVGEGTLGDML